MPEAMSYAVLDWEGAEVVAAAEAVEWVRGWDLGKVEGEEIDSPVTAGNHPELSPQGVFYAGHRCYRWERRGWKNNSSCQYSRFPG